MIGYNKSEIVGKMRERVILQNRIIIQSDSGFQSEIYNDIGIYWSKIEYKTGFEEEDADKITNQQKINIILRYNILVNVNSRFVYRNELYQVEKVEYSDDRRFMTCVCVWRSSYTSIYAGSIFCSASLLAQSSLSASLVRVINYQASLNAFGSVTAEINFVQKVASSLNANASLVSDINFVQKVQASLLTSASVTGNITIPKLVQASLTGTGTTAANLTVQAAGFDADAQAFFNRVTTAGGTLTTTEQNAVNTLVVQMKADGIWTKMKAIYPMVGGGQANPSSACRQNLISASFTGTFSSGWTFSSFGVTPNGTSTFMDTLVNPSLQTNWIINNHQAFYSRTLSPSGSGWNMGVGDFATGQPLFGLSAIRSTNIVIYDSGNFPSGRTSLAQTDARGFWLGSCTNSNTRKLIKNGTVIATNTNVDTNLPPNDNIYLGALNDIFTTNIYGMIHQIAFASIGDGLTDTEAANFYTAVQAFQTTLNRQV